MKYTVWQKLVENKQIPFLRLFCAVILSLRFPFTVNVTTIHAHSWRDQQFWAKSVQDRAQ
jgi:hypothetical protein